AVRTTRRGDPRKHLTRLLLPIVGVVAAVAFLATPATADPPSHVPGGPCLEDTQNVQLDSIPTYDEVVRQLESIAASSRGKVELASAGLSGVGRPLVYAT